MVGLPRLVVFVAGTVALGVGQTQVVATQVPAAPAATVTVDHNVGAAATHAFKFDHVPSPTPTSAATGAKVDFVAGDLDQNGAGLSALIDGLLPSEEDEPAYNFFFDAGTPGGSFRMDLGKVIDVNEVHSYSWHPNTRGPQVYALYGSDGTMDGFDIAPKFETAEPRGWTLIARVDTRVPGQNGGQYG